MSGPAAATSPRTHVPALDGVRGLAITLVLLFHFDLLLSGWLGVQLFFVLSGYLISGILLRERERSGFGFYLKRFYWRRTLRIFPAYYAYLLVVVAVFLLTGLPGDLPDTWPYLFTYTFNYTRLLDTWQHSALLTPLWSLSVEEQFYLLWPLVIFLTPSRALRPLLVGLMVLSPIVRYLLADLLLGRGHPHYVTGDAVYWFTFSQFDAFAAGAALHVFPRLRDLRRPGLLLALSTVVVLAAGALQLWLLRGTERFFEPSSLGYVLGNVRNGQHVWSYTLWNVVFGALILTLLSGRPAFLRRVFSHRSLIAVGRVSYGMYLIHWPVLALLRDAGFPSDAYLFPVYFAVVYVVALASFRWYEVRFLRLKDRRFALPPESAS